jgi:quinol monooxygenase YgiN
MFGTVARIKVKPGREQELLAVGEQWTQWLREHADDAGWLADYLFRLEGRPGEYITVGIFRDRESYFRNANDPETDRWYRRWRELLEADPEWNDGEIVNSTIESRA